MIRPNVLRHMLLLETAAGNWFTRLGEADQRAYLQAHPKSKFHPGGPREPADTTMHRDMQAHHEELERYHAGRSKELGERVGGVHDKAADLHRRAYENHRAADNGSNLRARGEASFRAGIFTKKANMATRKSIYDDDDAPVTSAPKTAELPSAANPSTPKTEPDAFHRHMMEHTNHMVTNGTMSADKYQQVIDHLRDKKSVDILGLSDKLGISVGQAKTMNNARKEYHASNKTSAPLNAAGRSLRYLREKHVGPR